MFGILPNRATIKPLARPSAYLLKGNLMTNELGKVEPEFRLNEINETNWADALLVQFRNEARQINSITNETSPIDILHRFNLIRETLSDLQDKLVERSLNSLKVGN